MAAETIATAMAARIAHRGPDAAGAWADVGAGIALGHRRLSILDLSEAGHQPMISADKRLVLVFNGEIYNHRSVRAEVMAAGWDGGWRGHSDTETLLAALQIWGVAATLPRLNGMFALAVWDREHRKLFLARDRAGEKPLYYGKAGRSILFGSELKALTAHPDWLGEVDRDVLALYLRHGYVPDPHSIYCGISKLPPAHWVEIGAEAMGKPTPYWSLAQAASAPRFEGSETDLLAELEARLMTAVELRMEADVPLGAFLSGGIDSSLVVAMMQARSRRPVRTFTIGFDVPGYNEAENAKAVAQHLGTEHTELYLTPQDALDVVPNLPRIWDEPFADSSQIPTLLLSQMTRQDVTVALSGDGGDELFCGYSRYAQVHRLNRLPCPLRRLMARMLVALPVPAIDHLMRHTPKRLQTRALGDRLNKLGMMLLYGDDDSLYRAFVSVFQSPGSLVFGNEEAGNLLSRPWEWPVLDNFRELMMYLDTLTYLPGDILTKVDRASMAVSLESRVPLLDHELIEFVWQLPFEMKLRNGQTKWGLRQVLERHVTSDLVNRPKKGFGIPIEHWLAGPLRNWAEDLLDASAMQAAGHLDAGVVRTMWAEHCSGRRRWHHQLWSVLMLEAWWRAK